MDNNTTSTLHLEDVTQDDVITAVRESAMLADVSISMWGGTRSDAKLLADMKAQHGAVGDVGRVVKNLLAGADSLLKTTRSAYSAVRLRHYAMTLPWVSDPHAVRQEGPRLIPNMILETYLTEMSAYKREAIRHRDIFIAAYPDLIVEARTNLGTMADGANYPSADEVKASFRVHFDIEPIPEFRSSKGAGVPLDNLMLERLSKALRSKQERQIKDMTRAVWERASTPIKNLVERLSAVDEDDGPKYFKEPTLEAVRELVVMLPGWNVTNDPVLDEITSEIRDLIDGLDTKTLRTNDTLRKETITDAQKVIDRMSKFGL